MESAQVEFLWKAMNVLPRYSKSCDILRCHLMSVCRSLNGHGDVHLPAKHTQKSALCRYCSNIWKNGKFSLKVLPQRILPKSIKKIVSRYNRDPSCIRKFEMGLARKYARKKNSLVITCGVCHKETKIDFFKPERKNVHESESPPKELLPEKKKKKKRYSRDPTAGLNIPCDFGVQKKSSIHLEKKNAYFENRHSSTSDICTPKAVVESKKSAHVMTAKINKKKRKSVESSSETPNINRRSLLKIQATPNSSSDRSGLKRLMKSDAIGNLFANAGKTSDSPLSQFLSSL